ncbi:MAG TPA: protein kinase [Longimicrobiales bacterium]|nr:protein kinase [Longimicrobiales bacterium]
MVNVTHDLTNALKQRYVLEREVGRGAMATVYLAREVHHNRQVALKVLDPELAHSLAAERFLREIRTAATLTHPNILPVHDSGRAAGLLYYVTPYVSGQTLRACLEHAGQLPVADALAIARQIADALAYAHEQGVVHRDIKPENILLTSGHQVWVADFGLAHALSGGADTRLTETGISIGSPLYMSPEQAAGSARIDGRADIYALGCVLYEMLAGAPPFMGDDIPSVLAKHLTAPSPRASHRNKEVPAFVEDAICKALEKSPNKRFGSAREFGDALSPAPQEWRMFRRRNLAIGGGLFFTAILGMLLFELPSRAVSLAGGLPWLPRASMDTTRYLVLPFSATDADGVEAQQLMHDALRRWRPVEVVHLLNVQEAVRDIDSEVTDAEARRIARAHGAGRVVRGSFTRSAGRYRVAAVLYDANRRNRIIDQASLPEDPAVSLDSLFAMLADSLLNDERGMNPRTAVPVGTMSRPAREDFRAGQRALLEWEVERADSLFAAAIGHDPDYAQAHLWLAEARSLLSDVPAQWQLLAERALAGKDVLTAKEQRLSEALYALATSQFVQACAIYDSLARANPHDFYAVYGTADCRRRDRMVVPAPNSESGWRFRSNFYRAILAYQRAFQLWPSTHKAYSANSFDRVRQLVFTRTAQLIGGHSREDERFVAAAAVRGDTLLFIPYPARLVQTANVRTSPEAVARLRRIFYDIARDWKAAYPESPVALEALALASDLRGDPGAAIMLIAKARAQTSDERYRAHLGALQVIISLKRALPHDRAGVRAAALLADSLVEDNAAESEWSEFAPTIALVAGRPHYAARAARAAVSAGEDDANLPYQIRADAQTLLAYASIGVMPDSISLLERRVHERVARVDSADRRAAFEFVLLRPVTMAFPVVRLGTLKSEDVGGDHLLVGQAALARGDRETARATILAKASSRRNKNPADLQFDAIYPEAWLLFAAGAPQLAARWLDPTLNALSEQDPTAFADLARMAGLLRSVELRVHIAHAMGDRAQARLWADALLLLWDDADPVLQPVAAAMRPYAGKRKP